MSELKPEDILKIIQEKSKELDVTAYEFGANTNISTMTAHNILAGEHTNTRKKTLDIMLQYLERKTINTVAEKEMNYVTLNDFTADQIIAYIHNNKDKFKNNKTHCFIGFYFL